jgi:cell division transport system permease protein
MAINAGYFLRESVQNFRRNWVMSLGAVITIFMSLLLVGLSLAAGYLVQEIVQDVEGKVTIQVFIKDGVATEDVDALQQYLLDDPLVASVDYTSKEEALEKFKEQMAESPEIVEQIEGNPLPASLDVTLNEPRDVTVVVQKIKDSELFIAIADRPDNPEESLKYGQQVVDQLFAVTRIVRYIGVVFIAMLAVVSLIFINNTIRLAIYARRKEIGIMRLVGASNWFIRAPFLLEGIMQALIGAAMAIIVIVGAQALILPRVTEALPFMPVDLPTGALVQMSLILIAAGIAIGLIGSGFALRRYLKV